MKTLSKKLISLMLVALMLVAAMPVMALADGTDTYDGESASSDEIVSYDMNVGVTVVVVCGDEELGRTDKNTTISNGYDSSDEDALAVTNKLYGKVSFANKSSYTVAGAGEYDGSTFTISVTLGKHTDNPVWDGAVGDESGHGVKCSFVGCTQTGTEPHKFVVVADSGKDNAEGHTIKCSVCGYTTTEAHSSKEIKSTVAAKAATCEEGGKTKQVTYKCGYVEGGESDGTDALGHTYKNGKCTRCGKAEGTSSYTVNISYDGDVIASGSAEMSQSTVDGYTDWNLANAKSVLGKSSSSDKLFKAYAGSMTASVFDSMDISGDTVTIYVKKDLSSSVTSETASVTIVDGYETEDRVLTVGKRYFDYSLALSNSNNKNLVSIRVTRMVNGKAVVRTINKGDNGSDSKVQPDDSIAELLWDGKKVTIKFYRSAGDGAELVSTMKINAGETIDNLPLLDGKYVSWYLPNGELLQEGRAYDFADTTINVYPYSNGLVYLQIFKNGDTKTPISNAPVDVTAYVQRNGIISASSLTSKIENAVGKKNLKITGLFDYDGWENYKSTKSTKYASSTIDVGNEDNRTGVQFLYVMVNGGSSSTADSSNPKTGDSAVPGTAAIVMAAAVIGLGTTAVVLKKKELF